MTLKIRKYGDPILKKKAEEVKEITPETKELILNMVETMQKERGIGLAAPQIGVAKRIIVVETGKGPNIFINPKIIDKGREKIVGEEGCLSLPGLYFKIKRSKEIKVRAENINGEELKIRAEGLLARIFQHETDHLDGILLIDRISFWQKLKLKNKIFK